jgi:hypothetical protein
MDHVFACWNVPYWYEVHLLNVPPKANADCCTGAGAFFDAGGIKYQRTRTDLLTHFLPASADATQLWIGFSFKSNATTRLRCRFDLKEKSWPNEMGNGARGRLNTFAH